jgi:hypothetical protein
MRYWLIWAIAVATAGLSTPAAGQSAADARDVTSLLARIGARIEQYFTRAQSIMCDERVLIRPLGYSSASDGKVRTLVYELRVAWDAAVGSGESPKATVLRELRTINGRRPGRNEDPGCMDPRSVSPEPLSMLLPGRREAFQFSLARADRDGRPGTVVLDYRPRERGADSVTWTEDCVSVDLPGRTVGRIWASADTGDVLRLDERLTGPFEFPIPRKHQNPFNRQQTSMTLENATSSTRYKPVRFQEPEETLMLPASIDSLAIWRGAGSRRNIITQTFSNCRRFLTDGRIVTDR